jgi:1,2-phenylacetyl-CoA epoxidase PaaB subunit
MTAKNPGKSVYKVTGTVFIEANSVRHAAHIAKGTFQMRENGPAIFVVEERQVQFGSPYLVDLTKTSGEKGYAEPIGEADTDVKIGGTDAW